MRFVQEAFRLAPGDMMGAFGKLHGEVPLADSVGKVWVVQPQDLSPESLKSVRPRL